MPSPSIPLPMDHGPCGYERENSVVESLAAESARTVVGPRLRNLRVRFRGLRTRKAVTNPGTQLFGKALVFMYHQVVVFQFALNQRTPGDTRISCRICSHFVSPRDNPPLPSLCLKAKGWFHGDSDPKTACLKQYNCS